MFEQTLSFPCPSCKETINDRMEKCRFCGAPIDKAIARQIGETQKRVNSAFSDAGYVKAAAFLMWGLLLVSLIPFVPWVSWAFLFTLVLVIFLIVRWYLKYGGINTSDPDYQKARRSIYLATILWLAALPVEFLIKPFVAYKIIQALS